MLTWMAHPIFSWLERQELNYWRSKMHVGKHVDLKKGLRVSSPHNVTVGDYVSISSDVTLQAHAPITIGDYSLIAAGVTIVTAGHPLDKREYEMRYAEKQPVTIGKNCWIGAGAVICPGVTIGDGAVVGAGSVVIRDLPAETICVGVPCKPARPRPKA